MLLNITKIIILFGTETLISTFFLFSKLAHSHLFLPCGTLNSIKCVSGMASKPKISAGLDRVLSYTEKSYIVSYYRRFSSNIKTGFDLIISISISAKSCL